MGSFFVNIYNYLNEHRTLRWGLLILSTFVLILLSLRVEYVEDITAFFPKNSQSGELFKSLKAKDKVAVMFTAECGDEKSQYQLMDCADAIAEEFSRSELFQQRASYCVAIDDSAIERVTDFVYDYIPLFLVESDYARLDEILASESIPEIMAQNYDRLVSPLGSYIADYIYRDPIGIGSEMIKELQNLGAGFSYEIVDNYLFSEDGRTLISYIEPHEGLDSKSTKILISAIESIIATAQGANPNIEIEYYGSPIVAEYNARQIKRDSMVTLNVALLLVVLLLSFAFRNRYSALLVLMPVVYGAIFSLAVIALVKGSISLIAVGAGSIIFGIALSYSIHMLSHTLYSADCREIIRDLAYPLTVGSFTTIGAFAGLLFTSSVILQDLGLFASLTLIGTTIYVLIFLPHFIRVRGADETSNLWLSVIDRCGRVVSKIHRPIIVVILLSAIVLLFFAGRVGFDSNMMNLNYEPPHLQKAGERLASFRNSRDGESSVFFLATSSADAGSAEVGYDRMCILLDSLKGEGSVVSYSSIGRFVVSDSVRSAKIERWQEFWSGYNVAAIIANVDRSADELGFDEGAFSLFDRMLHCDYQYQPYESELLEVFPDWVTSRGEARSYMAQVNLRDSDKDAVYELISHDPRMIAADRSFFTNRMAADVNHNFSLILYISGILVFGAMLLCYGRLEITLMAFAPMFVSWIVILGVMAICGIEFNIVTIILSTFIFGIGDDFSIFMMDGLLSEYRDNKKVLASHKTAILFSAFTVVVGMGVLIFAKHPAMHSLGMISLLGILIVVLVSYTLQPALFRLFITKATQRGGFPFTALSLLNTIYAFLLFFVGCMFVQSLILTALLLPISKSRKMDFIHYVVHTFCKCFLRVMVTTRLKSINDVGETFDKPAVIIANHQSFIDIIMLLGLNRRSVMVTNDWVWNSPFFGRIVRYLGFFNISSGYETIVDTLKERVNRGYSIVVFPEGTRSEDCRIKRLHKGAFYLAEQLELDILPVLIYGSGLVSSKRQGLYIKRGFLISKVLPRIAHNSREYGEGYKERTKLIGRYFKVEYRALYEEYNRVKNPYFRDAIIKSYIYKGPVVEWYMRVKLRLEGWYDKYDRLLPRSGLIVDLGCGYGAMSYMLSMLSDERTILGVDYDEQKIALADHSFLKNDRISFVSGDIRSVELPAADAFIISDVLHYINSAEQRAVILRCLQSLRPGGLLVIRDGDSSLADRHANTVESERWSTEIMKFNKSDGELCFLSREGVERIARECGADVKYIDEDSKLSNVLFVITKKGE